MVRSPEELKAGSWDQVGVVVVVDVKQGGSSGLPLNHVQRVLSWTAPCLAPLQARRASFEFARFSQG